MNKLIASEYTFVVNHAHSMSYFDKRGELVKKNKELFKYVDPSTKVDEVVILASNQEEEMEAYFSPEDFSTRLNDMNQKEVFYEHSVEFSKNVISSLGLDGYIDKVRFQISSTFEIDEDIRHFMEGLGFVIELPNDLIAMRSNLRILMFDQDNNKPYALSVQEMTLGEKFVNIEVTYILDKDELESEKSLLDKDFFVENFTELEKLFIKLNLVKEL
ncbi:RHS family protein [Bacillus altitudinis]|uniref:hypothetical protein n=1 Tax=Bacillus TaxID=1386 RepID=UPI00071ED7EB|nr:hypothetical protein [Bacillus altitudinis]QCU19880.1 hypothetical protein BPGQ101_13690 [Bacillus altitudinis]BAT49683.1 RHS family protein [Bacillus pumilus]